MLHINLEYIMFDMILIYHIKQMIHEILDNLIIHIEHINTLYI